MDRDTELAHLAVSEKAVAEGERHIVRQEERVAELDRDGHDTKQALETLATFRRNQAEHIAHRDLLLKMLQQDAAKLQFPFWPNSPAWDARAIADNESSCTAHVS